MRSGWSTVPISQLYQGLYDGPHATPKPSESGPIFLGIKNVTDDGHLDLSVIRHIAEEEFERWTRRVEPREGDIVFTYEATLNRYAIIPAGFRGCLGRRMALIRPNLEEVDTKFLFYYFFSPEWRRTIAENTLIGSTVNRIPLTGFPDFPVTLPSLEVQRSISEVLEVYDDLIENCQRRITILEEMARSLYREWFVHFRFPGHEECEFFESELGAIPTGWNVCSFTEVADVLSGGTPKTKVPEYWNGEIPFFTPRDAPGEFYVFDTEKHLSAAGLDKCASRLYDPDTVFITARGTVGKVALPAVPMAMNQSCYALKGREGVSQRFLYLMTLQQVAFLRKNTGGATFDTIIVDTFRRMRIVAPPSALIQKFSEVVDPFFDQVRTLLDQVRVLRNTRDLLLPRLMSGHINLEEA